MPKGAISLNVGLPVVLPEAKRNELKERRNNLGVTLDVVGLVAGVGGSTVSSIETGRRAVRSGRVEAVCAALSKLERKEVDLSKLTLQPQQAAIEKGKKSADQMAALDGGALAQRVDALERRLKRAEIKSCELEATINRLVKVTKDHGELIARLLGKSNQRDGEIRDAINRLNESVAEFTKSTSSKPPSLFSKIFGD